MRDQCFILAIDSYLARKGMATILHRMDGVRISSELGSAEELLYYLKHHSADYMIISESIFQEVTHLFVSDSGLIEKTILLKREEGKDPAEEVRASIYLTENRDDIIRKIEGLLFHGSSGFHSHPLTQREKHILRLISMGLTNKQIAEKLFLSTHTVTTHRKNITSKLGIKSVSGLTVYAIVNNIITIDEVTSNPS